MFGNGEHRITSNLSSCSGCGWNRNVRCGIDYKRFALTDNLQWDRLIAYMIGLIFLFWTVPIVERETMVALLTGEERIAIAASDRWLGALERVGGVALMLVGLEYLVPFAFVPRVLLQRAEWHDSPLQMRFFAKTAISFSSAILAGILLAKVPLPFF